MTSDCQWAWLFSRAMESYRGSSSSAQTQGWSCQLLTMKGVTKLACNVTSPLGKLWQQLPLNHLFGSSPWVGRARPIARLSAVAAIPEIRDESRVCQNVWPSGASL